MRRRFLINGLDGFSDHEVLELLLFYALPRQDVNPMAHALIQRFGSLPAALDAPREELCAIRGVGPKVSRFLTLIPDVLFQTEYRLFSPSRAPLRAPDDLSALLLQRTTRPVPGDVYVIVLDPRYCVKAAILSPPLTSLTCGNWLCCVWSLAAPLWSWRNAPRILPPCPLPRVARLWRDFSALWKHWISGWWITTVFSQTACLCALPPRTAFFCPGDRRAQQGKRQLTNRAAVAIIRKSLSGLHMRMCWNW